MKGITKHVGISNTYIQRLISHELRNSYKFDIGYNNCHIFLYTLIATAKEMYKENKDLEDKYFMATDDRENGYKFYIYKKGNSVGIKYFDQHLKADYPNSDYIINVFEDKDFIDHYAKLMEDLFGAVFDNKVDPYPILLKVSVYYFCVIADIIKEEERIDKIKFIGSFKEYKGRKIIMKFPVM